MSEDKEDETTEILELIVAVVHSETSVNDCDDTQATLRTVQDASETAASFIQSEIQKIDRTRLCSLALMRREGNEQDPVFSAGLTAGKRIGRLDGLKEAADAVLALETGRMTAGNLTCTDLLARMVKEDGLAAWCSLCKTQVRPAFSWGTKRDLNPLAHCSRCGELLVEEPHDE